MYVCMMIIIHDAYSYTMVYYSLTDPRTIYVPDYDMYIMIMI